MFRDIDKEILREIAGYETKTKWGEIFKSDKPRWEILEKEEQLCKQGYVRKVISSYMELAPLLAENEAITKYCKNSNSGYGIYIIKSLEHALKIPVNWDISITDSDLTSLKELFLTDELMQPKEKAKQVSEEYLMNKLMDEKFCAFRDLIIKSIDEVKPSPYGDEFVFSYPGNDFLNEFYQEFDDGHDYRYEKDYCSDHFPRDYIRSFLAPLPLYEVHLMWLFTSQGRMHKLCDGLYESPIAKPEKDDNFFDLENPFDEIYLKKAELSFGMRHTRDEFEEEIANELFNRIEEEINYQDEDKNQDAWTYSSNNRYER